MTSACAAPMLQASIATERSLTSCTAFSADLVPESLEEKVVCYADKFFSKSRIDEPPKSLERARQSLAKFGGDTLSRFDDLVALFGDPADLGSAS